MENFQKLPFAWHPCTGLRHTHDTHLNNPGRQSRDPVSIEYRVSTQVLLAMAKARARNHTFSATEGALKARSAHNYAPWWRAAALRADPAAAHAARPLTATVTCDKELILMLLLLLLTCGAIIHGTHLTLEALHDTLFSCNFHVHTHLLELALLAEVATALPHVVPPVREGSLIAPTGHTNLQDGQGKLVDYSTSSGSLGSPTCLHHAHHVFKP